MNVQWHCLASSHDAGIIQFIFPYVSCILIACLLLMHMTPRHVLSSRFPCDNPFSAFAADAALEAARRVEAELREELESAKEDALYWQDEAEAREAQAGAGSEGEAALRAAMEQQRAAHEAAMRAVQAERDAAIAELEGAKHEVRPQCDWATHACCAVHRTREARGAELRESSSIEEKSRWTRTAQGPRVSKDGCKASTSDMAEVAVRAYFLGSGW
eukprot:6112269-Pleurochrysis_carterae.AAC.5